MFAVALLCLTLDASLWMQSEWISAKDAPVYEGVIKDGLRAADGTSWFVQARVNEKEVRRATWMTTALGVYELYVNGQAVGEDFLKPGYTSVFRTRLAFTYDVTRLFDCAAGARNVLAAEVSSGWWRDKIVTPKGGGKGFFGRKSAFRGVLRLEYADGTQATFGTNCRDWKSGTCGPVLQAGIYDGETYDARRAPGYAVLGTLAESEPNAEFKGAILPTDGAEVCLRRDLELKSVRAYVWKGVTGESKEAFGTVKVLREAGADAACTLAPGETLVVDFGQNAAAVPLFRFEAAEGTVLTALPAEMLNDGNGLRSRGNDGPEGSVYRVNLRNGHDTGRLVRYTFASTRGAVSYHPRFTYFGYRYVSVTATGPVRIESIRSLPVSSIRKEDELGSVETGDADVNRFVSNVYWGQLSNYLSVPTDCPQRNERLGWSADTQVFCEAGSFNADTTRFFRKWMRDLCDCQGPRGGFPSVAPFGQYGNETMRVGWADVGVIVPWTIWKQFADRSIIDRNWAAMERYLARVAETKYDLAAIFEECEGKQYADWLSFEDYEPCNGSAYEKGADGKPDKSRIRPDAVAYWNYLGASYWIVDARMMAQMAAATGRRADARKYEQMAAEALAYARRKFVDPQTGLLLAKFRHLQGAAVFALYTGLLETDAARETTKADLRANIAGHGGLTTGFLSTAILMDTLTQHGMSDVAYDLLLNHRCPSWLYSVDQGATTVWERWNSYTKKDGFGPVGMNSFNHYAYGSVLAWLYKSAAGIAADVERPGFANIVMAPQPDRRLGRIAASYRTPHGVVRSAWRYEGASWIWTFTVPAGSTATVTVPGDLTATVYRAGTYTVERRLK